MFTEPIEWDKKTGWIEVICGSMFSGKTEELIRRLKRARIAGLNTVIFKPCVDVRYSADSIVSHDQNAILSTAVTSAEQILLFVGEAEVVGIDEAQFFDEKIIDVANLLANKGIRVVIAGLDMDFKGKPFGPMPNLLAIAEFVTKLHAICAITGQLAHYSYRKVDEQNPLLLGEKEAYEPVSRAVFKHKKF